MATTIIRQRIAKPVRWQAALNRALASGVRVYRIAGTGEAVVTSQSEAGTVYRTDGTSCECAAAVLGGDPVCAHRAAYWFEAGMIDFDPEPEPPGSTVAAEREAAIAELARLESLLSRGHIKSTSDWHRLHNARDRVAALEGNA